MGVGRPRLKYVKQINRNTEADSYRAMKRVGCKNFGWETAKKLKDMTNKKKSRRRSISIKIEQINLMKLY